MDVLTAQPGKMELDFEGLNWGRAREVFKSKHKDTDQRRDFLCSQTTGVSVKYLCLKLQGEADHKYRPGFDGILKKVNALMKVGDIAIKSAPESVGLAWMGIRTCLHAVQGDFSTFQLFSSACAGIIGIMISCRAYGKMYGNGEGPQDFQELHSKVVDYIPTIYAEILDFSYAVRKYTNEHMVIRVGKSVFGNVKNKFQAQIDDIQKHEAKMREFANIATDRLLVYYQKTGLVKQDVMSSDISFMKEALDANLKANELFVRHIEALEEERKEMRKKTPFEKAKEEFAENRKLLNPSEDQSEVWKENLARREKDTCQWIFDLDEYKDWYASSESSMLWVSGSPGYGKSILMSSVIEKLKTQPDDSNYLVQFFFCKTGDDATQTTTRILQNIACQLYAVSETSPDLLDKTNEVMKKVLNKKGANQNKTAAVQLSSQASSFDFQRAYDGLTKAIGRTVFLIIDALDECNDRQDKDLLKELRSVGKEAGLRTKIMVCSRPEADIANDLSDIPKIKCEGHNEADIRKNVTAELRKFPSWTASEKIRACDEIVRKAGGQFRYVDIALNFLRKPLIRPYEKALEQLPDGLTGSYISSWKQTDTDYLDLLKIALTWTILAEGAVTVPEVMDAYSRTYFAEVGIHEELESSQVTDTDIDLHDSQVRIAGGNFLEVSQSRIISLRHITVKEFFLKKEKESNSQLPNKPYLIASQDQLKEEQTPSWTLCEKIGHLELARVLAQHLASPAFQKKYLLLNEEEDLQSKGNTTALQSSNKVEKELRNEQAPVLSSGNTEIFREDGATDCGVVDDTGTDDIASQAASPETSREITNEASEDPPNGEADKTKQECVTAEETGRRMAGDRDEQEDDQSDDDEDYIPYNTSYEYNAPQVKSNQGIRYEITHWAYHLKKAESHWSREERELSPEWAELWNSLASFMCDSSMAFKAWQRMQLYDSDSPLCCAGYKTVYGPLHIAAAYDVTALVEMLIDHGEDVNERLSPTIAGELARTPLELAAGSNISLMKLLLENKADPNSKANGPTAFHWAALRNPTVECIQLFLDHNANVNIIDELGSNVMHYFSYYGTDPQALRLLVNAGGNINIADRYGETPLHKLVSRGDLPLDLLKAYLEEKAEVNIENNYYQRPLYDVCAEGSAGAAKLLIESGADVHHDDRYGMTALHAAAMRGRTEIVKLLLENGAAANWSDKKGRTPFFYACQGGHEETAQCLLEVLQGLPGHEINKTNDYGRTPLRKAAARGCVKIVEMLLDKIDAASAVNAKDSKLKQTPLHTAAYNGQKEVLEVLLKAGADLSLTDKNGMTPLQLCGQGWARSDSEDIENALLFLIDKDEGMAVTCGDLLYTGASKGSVNVIEKLLTAGADPNLRDQHGWTPLLVAQQYRQEQAVEALSRKGAVLGTKPTKWVSSENFIEVSEDGLEVHSTDTDCDRTSIVSNHPIPAGTSKYYFEVEILSAESSGPQDSPAFGLGLTTQPARLRQMPGHFNPGARTWAWHGDDGWIFDNSWNGTHVYGGGPYGPGDVVGCAVDFDKETIFYTRNGKRYGPAFEGVRGRLYPVVGLLGKVALKVNFGEDIEAKQWAWEGWREWKETQAS